MDAEQVDKAVFDFHFDDTVNPPASPAPNHEEQPDSEEENFFDQEDVPEIFDFYTNAVVPEGGAQATQKFLITEESDEECFVDQDDEDPAPSSEYIFGSPWPAVPSISPASSELHGSHQQPHPQPSQAKPTFFPHRGFLFQTEGLFSAMFYLHAEYVNS